jgi:hypothetical protein
MKRALSGIVTASAVLSLWASFFGCSPKNDDTPNGNSACTSNLQCLNGQECSGGKCVPFTACPATACAAGQMCVAGVCRAGCNSNAECGALICDLAQHVCQPAPNPAGMGGASGVAGGTATAGSGTGGTAGSGTGGNSGVSGAGTMAGSGGGGGSAPMECSTDPNLALHGGWVGCDPAAADDNPMGLQGSIYMYHDGSSCTSPAEPCGATGCCIKGATVVDATNAKWGCGLGFELNSTGGDAPMKKAYTGAAKCFDIKLTGSSGGNPVRIAYTQNDVMDGKVAPFVQLTPFTNGYSGTVCLADVTCPNWMPKPDCALGGPFDLQIQVVGGGAAGAFDLCLSQLIPRETAMGQATLGQICGVIGENDKEHLISGTYRIQNNVLNANSGKQCITAKAGGGAAGFTIDSSTLNTGGNSPVAYPSVVYGWHFGEVTTGTGLPKALSAIASAPSTVTYVPPSGGKFNAAYDIWAMPTSAGANPANPKGGLEVMIWLAQGGGANPITDGSQPQTVTINKRDYKMYIGQHPEGWSVVTFWANNFVGGWTNEDLKPFLDKAVSIGKAQNDWNLHSVQFGFEIWNGGAGATVSSFSQSIK